VADAGGADTAVAREAGSPDASPSSSNYADPNMWLCGAGAPHDYCLDMQTATAILPDGGTAPVTLSPAASPSVDCFYVYPSVDITSPAGNETSFSNLPDILDPVRSQAAPFSQVCKVYAPLYHQATYQSYYSANAEQYLEVAYTDVAAAFAEYLAHYNSGRDIVLLGHSQGSQMLRRLIQRQIENNAAVARQLAVALLIGPFGDVTVLKGTTVGGSFVSTPLCTADDQRDCVITFDTFAKGYDPPSSSSYDSALPDSTLDFGCNNPAALGGGKAVLQDGYFFTKYNNTLLTPPQTLTVSTNFALYGDYFTGQCLIDAAGNSFFEVDDEPAAGDTRSNPIPFGNSLYYSPALLGLHLLDFAFPMQDLLDAVTKRATGAVVDAGAD
jgi:hypothetical protein